MGTCLSAEQRNKATQPENPKKRASHFNAANYLAPAKDVEDLRLVDGHGNVNIFSYNELRAATKNFRPDQILGEGGFGTVYKGYIDEGIKPGFNPTQVAVKELNPDGLQGDKEWLAELNYLGQLSHPNLVKLIGYCCEGLHRLLVYEYMASGSLEKHLFRRVCLTLPWSTRMKIALGAAKGLAFLHESERPIIYRDFKTSNILLDAEYNAKLSDFGLAKEGPTGNETHVSTRVMGTFGYAAPEYVMTGHLTPRSDVYGFGVVVLEMLLGKRAMDKNRPSREYNLVEWARPLLIHSRKLLRIMDPRLEGQYSNKVVVEVACLVYRCLSQNPKGRPTMSQVVERLETLQDLPDSNEDLMFQSCGGAITLYEVPKESLDTKSEKNQGDNEQKTRSRRRSSHGNVRGRSKSEPYLEFSMFPSPDYESHKPVKPLNDTKHRIVKPSIPEAYDI